MKRNLKKWTAVLAAAVMLLVLGTAGAETLSLSGTVEAGASVPVWAPIGGTVESVNVEEGMRVSAGDVLYTYKTEKIYAEEDGTVTGVFAQPGDDAESVTERWGACLYIEGTTRFTVSASLSKAYSDVETNFVHVGETVYLQDRTNSSRGGEGIITAVSGSSYTVTVTSGTFIADDQVYIYRDAEFSDSQRIGRGSVSRVSPVAVTGSGAVVSVAVKDGDQVKRGDLLMETLTGTFDAYEMTGTEVKAAEEGVVMSVSASAGNSLNKGDAALQIVPASSVRVEAKVSADERKMIKAGDSAAIELETDESKTYTGTVRYVSEVPEEGEDEVTYKVVIDFTPDTDAVLGMNVVVTFGAEDKAEPAEETQEEEPAEEAAAEETAQDGEGTGTRPERPEGFPELPEGFEPPEGFDPSQGFPGAPEAAEEGSGD